MLTVANTNILMLFVPYRTVSYLLGLEREGFGYRQPTETLLDHVMIGLSFTYYLQFVLKMGG